MRSGSTKTHGKKTAHLLHCPSPQTPTDLDTAVRGNGRRLGACLELLHHWVCLQLHRRRALVVGGRLGCRQHKHTHGKDDDPWVLLRRTRRCGTYTQASGGCNMQSGRTWPTCRPPACQRQHPHAPSDDACRTIKFAAGRRTRRWSCRCQEEHCSNGQHAKVHATVGHSSAAELLLLATHHVLLCLGRWPEQLEPGLSKTLRECSMRFNTVVARRVAGRPSVLGIGKE